MPAHTKPMLGREIGKVLKEELGKYIRDLREARSMTQSDLAKAVGMNYYTGISAIEVGRNVVPPERLVQFADALGVPHQEFGKKVLGYTNPWAYALLFEADPHKATAEWAEWERLNRRKAPRN
jgi:transcriptional regulator with XRE-family HTH domain